MPPMTMWTVFIPLNSLGNISAGIRIITANTVKHSGSAMTRTSPSDGG